MATKASLQLNLPPSLVNRVDSHEAPEVHKVDMTLEEAQKSIGHAVRMTIKRTDSGLKDFGDKSLVNKVCDGQIPQVLARVFQRPDTRREWILALAQEDGSARITFGIDYEFIGKKRSA